MNSLSPHDAGKASGNDTSPPTSAIATLDVHQAPQALAQFVLASAAATDTALRQRLGVPTPDPGKLSEAMLYAATGGGKRLRPALAFAVAEAVGMTTPLTNARALSVAAAIEMLHAYTLVHDDLPAMDDDDMRRGRPTVHIAFGEATAILAGDGLLTHAFATLCELGADAGRAVACLAARTGHHALLQGQAIDLASDKATMQFAELRDLHAKKTGALFAAAAELGAIAAGASTEIATSCGEFGMAIGIAFQHADDRDDGEWRQFAAQATADMQALCARAQTIADHFGPQGRMLAAFAQWIGGKA